jgi:hypothetical protein
MERHSPVSLRGLESLTRADGVPLGVRLAFETILEKPPQTDKKSVTPVIRGR